MAHIIEQLSLRVSPCSRHLTIFHEPIYVEDHQSLHHCWLWEYEMSHCMTKPTKWQCSPSENSDKPGHLPSLISLRYPMKKHWALNYLLSAQWRLWSDWADAQADPSLRWEHMSFCWFCRAVVPITFFHHIQTYWFYLSDQISVNKRC